jgi:hypothetical protein
MMSISDSGSLNLTKPEGCLSFNNLISFFVFPISLLILSVWGKILLLKIQISRAFSKETIFSKNRLENIFGLQLNIW